MEKLDIAIIVVGTLVGLKCFRDGFTRSVWGIAAVSAGGFAASQLWPNLSPFLQRWIQNKEIAKWASIIALIVSVSILIDMMFARVQKVIDRGVLGWINSAVGGAFGIVTSCILLGTILILGNRFGGESIQEAIAESRLGPLLIDIGYQVFDFGRDFIRKQSDQL